VDSRGSFLRLALLATWAPAVLFCAASAYPARSAVTYSVTDLGDLPGGADSSGGGGINSLGQVIGTGSSSTGNRAFLWTPTTPNGITGSMIDLGDLPGELDFSIGKGINDFGQVTGWSGAIPGGTIFGSRAFLWTPTTPNGTTGSMIDLGPLSGASDGSLGTAINASGQVAGFSANDRAFLWTPATPHGTTGSMAPLGSLSGPTGTSQGIGINTAGQVTGMSFPPPPGGRSPFLWTPSTPNGTTGSMVNLGGLSGGSNNSLGSKVNDAGQVTGWSYAATGQRAFLWTPTTPNGSTGSMIDLGDLPGGADQSEATGINGLGHVVGYSASTGDFHAFLWTAADQMLDLNALLNSSGAGWTLRTANGINTLGQITGSGLYDPDGPGDIAAVSHAYLAPPVVPAPGGLAAVTIVIHLTGRRGTRLERAVPEHL
jgi:probable HAF family extracellular repeat protein